MSEMYQEKWLEVDRGQKRENHIYKNPQAGFCPQCPGFAAQLPLDL